MSKKKNNAPTAFEAGKAITISAKSRQDAADQLAALRKQAAEAGLIQGQGGFVTYREGIFSAVITFVEQ